MKITKEQRNNAIWILAIILILFTPVGFHLKVFVGKLFATSASIIESDEQKTFAHYNWNLIDLEGEPLHFEANRGKVTLVNFWATWCPPCVAEMPSLQKLFNDYGEKVEFVFVTNEDSDTVMEFMQKKGYELPIYAERSRTPKELVSRSIPATYIISKSGKIVVDEKGAANWNSERIRDLLDELLGAEVTF